MAKIKVRPEDFVVEELIKLSLVKKGSYTILKLEKRLWNTLDVIEFIARTIHAPKRLFARAGLKDRYSLSTQYLSFKGNLKHTIKEKNFTVKPIGKSNTPVNPKMLLGNYFCITLRNLTEKEVDKLDRNPKEIERYGFPNYFDEQRFGSARHGQGFIAKKLIFEHYGGALKLLMCYAHKEDSAREKKFKAYCLSHWRDWYGCLEIAPPFYRPILNYLIEHPKDFKNALKQIDKEFLNIYLLAYQSFLFNEVLFRIVKAYGQNNVPVKYSMGELLFYHELPQVDSLRELHIPMINEKTNLAGHVGQIIGNVLKKEGIMQKSMALQKMRLRGVRFKPFERDTIVYPKGFELTQLQPDEIYEKKYRCTLKCILPPGTYATILIKRLLLGSDPIGV
jgi:tRNA pseudouridine13 synthase